MIDSEFKAVLADEKQREQWLKRLLPALAVTVVYFVFISPILGDKYNKAENEFLALKTKGIDENRLPGINKQLFDTQSRLAALKKKDADVRAGLAAKAGFLYGQADMNAEIGKIATLMQAHGLAISEEYSVGTQKSPALPKSLLDIKQWLGDNLKTEGDVHVHRIRFVGGYVDTYETLQAMAGGDIKVLPISLAMENPDESSNLQPGLKAWTLDLWL